jgi:hypothetical protein
LLESAYAISAQRLGPREAPLRQGEKGTYRVSALFDLSQCGESDTGRDPNASAACAQLQSLDGAPNALGELDGFGAGSSNGDDDEDVATAASEDVLFTDHSLHASRQGAKGSIAGEVTELTVDVLETVDANQQDHHLADLLSRADYLATKSVIDALRIEKMRQWVMIICVGQGILRTSADSLADGGLHQRESRACIWAKLQQIASIQQRDTNPIVADVRPIRGSEVFDIEVASSRAGDAGVTNAHVGVLDYEVGVGCTPNRDRPIADRDESACMLAREQGERGPRLGFGFGCGVECSIQHLEQLPSDIDARTVPRGARTVLRGLLHLGTAHSGERPLDRQRPREASCAVAARAFVPESTETWRDGRQTGERLATRLRSSMYQPVWYCSMTFLSPPSAHSGDPPLELTESSSHVAMYSSTPRFML